jgi:hypothetical protein
MVINFLHLNGLNNLSTQLTGDIVRIGQCVQMRDDPELSVDVYRTIPEVLGVIDVIVSDKTGTLTENALKLRKVLVSDTMFDLRQGSFEKELNLETSKTGKIREFLEMMALCNNVLPKGSEIYSCKHFYFINFISLSLNEYWNKILILLQRIPMTKNSLTVRQCSTAN